jgi:hypothetical protein
MRLRTAGLLAVAALAASGCTPPPAAPPTDAAAPAPAASGYTPVVSLNEIMVYVVDPHSNELWDAAMVAPRNDQEWAQLQRAAVAIAGAGSLTRLSGNGPNDQQWIAQADWAKYSQDVADAGLAALQAVRAKDTAALAKAGDQLVLTCINCHREYKLDVPTIWTERQFPPEEQRP